jgi:hypothetical protein
VQFVGDNVRFLRDAFDGLVLALKPLGAGAPGSNGGRAPAPEAPQRGPRGDDSGVAERTGADLVSDLAFLTEEVPLAIDQTLQGVERIATIVRAMKAYGHPSNEDKAPADLNQAARNTLVVASNAFKDVADVVTELGAPGSHSR